LLHSGPTDGSNRGFSRGEKDREQKEWHDHQSAANARRSVKGNK